MKYPIPPYNLTESHGGHYFPPPYSGFDLFELRWGLPALGVLATLSVVSSLILIAFLVSRFVTWRIHYKTFIGYNQYVVLVLNLLIADLQQSASFLISWHWFRLNAILAPSTACFAQGWLIHSGDMGGGLFVLAIAVHTFYTAVYGRRMSNKVFYSCIAGVWAFSFVLTAIGVGIHGDKLFVRAGAWCWISNNFEPLRLWCHYFWIFLIEFGVIALYIVTFFCLRRRTSKNYNCAAFTANSGHTAAVKAVNRVTLMMMLYPFFYVLLTLPLSIGRMWSMAHDGAPTSGAYSVVAGSLLASCGWIDTLLYTLTRRRLLQDTMPNASGRRTSGTGGRSERVDSAQNTNNKSILQTRTVTVETDGLSDFEMAFPGGSHVTNFYNIESIDNSPTRTGVVETFPASPAGLTRIASAAAIARRQSQVENQSRSSKDDGHKPDEEEFPSAFSNVIRCRDPGWTKLLPDG